MFFLWSKIQKIILDVVPSQEDLNSPGLRYLNTSFIMFRIPGIPQFTVSNFPLAIFFEMFIQEKNQISVVDFLHISEKTPVLQPLSTQRSSAFFAPLDPRCLSDARGVRPARA